MVELDPRSVAYAAATVGTMLLVLIFAYWSVRKTYPGFGHWVVSLSLLVIALTGISWYELMPTWFSEMTVNAASIGAMLFAATGAHHFFRGRPLDQWTLWSSVAGLSAVFAVQFTGPEIVRAGLGGTVMGVLALRAAHVFVWPTVRGLRLGSRLCALLLVAMAIERFWRAGFFVSALNGQPMMDPHLAALINHSFNASFITLWTMAFLFVNASRVELDLRQSRKELEDLVKRDPLTGALNRRAFLELTQAEVAKVERYGIPLSLVIVDLDRFKQINDRYGHPTGDQVLVKAVEILGNSFRDTDEVARLGGEEFAVLMLHTPANEALNAARRLRRRFERELLIDEGDPHGVTASIGVGQFRHDQESFEDLFARVDAAMYAAKRAGRNRVRMSDPGAEGALSAGLSA